MKILINSTWYLSTIYNNLYILQDEMTIGFMFFSVVCKVGTEMVIIFTRLSETFKIILFSSII